MRPPLPLRRLLLSVLATCLVLTTPAAAAVATCAPRTCGNVTLAYPFWLTDASQPAPCGPSVFQVDCLAGGRAALAHSFRGSYKLLRVSYADRTVVVANDNVQTDAAGCPVPRIDVSASLSLAPFSASAANRQLLFLFNCTVPPATGFVNVTCPGKQAVVRLDAVYNTTAARAVAGRCDYAAVPVVGSLSPGGSAGKDYPRLLREGYLLEWRASAGDCGACAASGGRCGYDSNADAFTCVCADGSSRPARCGRRRTFTKIVLIVSTSAAATLLFPCMYFLIWHRKGKRLWFLLCKKTRSNAEKNYEAMIVSYGSLAPKRYMYSEVMRITSSRSDQLGRGGYGVVFKGRLHDGRLVAVKFLHDCKGNGDEFVNEVMSIGRTSHVNIVSLFGFCLEGSKRALIYEYMSNGSLDKYIYSENPKEILGWERLYAIAIGIARGLEYLHHSCNTRIVHFDIKPQNILLDKNFSPKIADFGLAKLCHTKESKLSMTGARGTIGFIAPEVHSRTFGAVSTKSDVYSYGMMLLEMVGGGRNIKSTVEKSSEKYFPDWIYDHLAQDDGLQACEVISETEEIARKMILVGLWCIQVIPSYRPSITEVLEMFERSLDDLDMPPKQNFRELLESSAHNLDVQSASSTRPEEISLVDSKNAKTTANPLS